MIRLMSLMMDEILEQPRALARTFKAERAHAAELNIMAPNSLSWRLSVLRPMSNSPADSFSKQ